MSALLQRPLCVLALLLISLPTFVTAELSGEYSIVLDSFETGAVPNTKDTWFHGPVKFVWTVTCTDDPLGCFDDDSYMVELLRDGATIYTSGIRDGNYEDIESGVLNTVGGKLYEIEFRCFNGFFWSFFYDRCEGDIFKFALVDCGCPTGLEVVEECTADAVDTAADAVCQQADCGPGTFIKYISGEKTCVDCPAGKYSNQLVSTKCTDCPAGLFSNRVGATACQKCPGGFFSDQGADACDVCPKGTFSSEGAHVCQACPNGTYSYQGAHVCQDCPTTGDIPDQCQSCPIGTYLDAISQFCIDCPSGTYSDQLGAKKCNDCPAGEFSDEGGGTDCQKCPAGFFSPHLGAKKCKKCPAGEYSDVIGAKDCKKCPAGFFSGKGEDSCEACPAGTYSQGGVGICEVCPAGTYSDDGADACHTCPTTDELPSQCRDCPKGGYFDEDSQVCKDCPSGTYSNVYGANKCEDCPHKMITESALVDYSGAKSPIECGNFKSVGFWSGAAVGSPGGSSATWTLEKSNAVSPGVSRTANFARAFSDLVGKKTSLEMLETEGWVKSGVENLGINAIGGSASIGAEKSVDQTTFIVGGSISFLLSEEGGETIGYEVSKAITQTTATTCQRTCNLDASNPFHVNNYVYNWVEVLYDAGLGVVTHFIRTCYTWCKHDGAYMTHAWTAIQRVSRGDTHPYTCS